MNNLIGNYEIILENLKRTCGDIKSHGQVRKPKLGNMELVALNLTAEYMSINTELQLFRVIKDTYLEGMMERSVHNKGRRRLFDYTEAVRKCLSGAFAHFTDVFVVDPKPTPICNYARAGRSAICSTYDIRPSFGYCVSQKSNYYGYKRYATGTVCSIPLTLPPHTSTMSTILGT